MAILYRERGRYEEDYTSCFSRFTQFNRMCT